MISIIIPAYNEEKRLSRTIVDLSSFLKSNNIESEILIVNDGSTDNTSRLDMPASNIRMINLFKNIGKGGAVKEGVLSSMGDIIIFIDSDNSINTGHIKEAVALLDNEYDIVIGSRELKDSITIKDQPRIRKIVGRIFSFLVKLIRLSSIEDTQCGFKAFKSNAAREIFKKAKIKRFAFDVEILCIAKVDGYRVKEIPVKWINNEDSRVTFKSIFVMLLDIIRIRYYLSSGKYGKKNSKRIG